MKRNLIKMMALGLSLTLSSAVTVPAVFAAGAQTQAKEESVKGILEPSKGGLVLRDLTSGIRYQLAGKDVSGDRGKMVTITGQVTDDGQGHKTINVKACEPVKQ